MIRLQTERLTLAVAGRTLVRDLNIELRAGENWMVLGANGSGKTTLLHTLAGLRAPATGAVRLDGTPIGRHAGRERARRLALLLQQSDGALPATVLEMVLSGRHPHLGLLQWESGNDRDLALAALAQVDLAGFETRMLDSLSGGERRRAEIAAVLAQDAAVGLYDEPTLNLDLRHQIDILRLLASRSTRPGHVNVFVLHDPYLAQRFGTHGLMLFADGEHVHGPLERILTRPNLERLYGCALHAIRDGSRALYLPV